MASHTGAGAGAHERIENDGAGRRVNLRSATQLVRQLTVRLHHFKIESIFKFVQRERVHLRRFFVSLVPHARLAVLVPPL